MQSRLRFLGMLSSLASYPQLMHSKNSALILLITIFTPLISYARRRESNEDNISLRKDEHSFQRGIEELRGRFIKKYIEKQKVRLLEQITNNTIMVDGVPHIDIERSGDRKNEIMAMENGFRSLLGMNGVEYTYKRGYHWRTWRQIDHKGNITMVCYKCNSAGNTTCKNCIGYWVIEEAPPPCPFEIISIRNDRELCVINYTERINLQSVCPTLLNINNLLITCNNPVETEWRINSNFNKNSASTLSVICGGQEGCEILTLYTILPDSILFRIINGTNHVIYSRVMKRGDKNYACVQNCGVFDRKTKTVLKNEKPLIVNLLRSFSFKNKREYNIATVNNSSIFNVTLNLSNSKILRYMSKNILYKGPHSRHVRTTEMERYNSKTSQEFAKLKEVQIPRLGVKTIKPSDFQHATLFRHLLNGVHYKNSPRNVSSDRIYNNINAGDSIANTVEIVTKTVCKKLEDKYKEEDISETIED